jgi:hypothetical protein
MMSFPLTLNTGACIHTAPDVSTPDTEKFAPDGGLFRYEETLASITVCVLPFVSIIVLSGNVIHEATGAFTVIVLVRVRGLPAASVLLYVTV